MRIQQAVDVKFTGAVSVVVWIGSLLLVGCSPRAPESLTQLPVHTLEIGPGGNRMITLDSTGSKKMARPKGHPWSVPEGVGVRKWRYIVIHHSATEIGNAEIFDRSHRLRGFDELGYHFVINNGRGETDGRVEVGSRWTRQKWGAHTGGTPDNEFNNYGIGVALVGDFSNKLPSEAQLRSLDQLVGYLVDSYNIPAENVIGHRQAPNACTECPGDALQHYISNTLRPRLHKREN